MCRKIQVGFRLLAIAAVALALGGCGGGGGGGGTTGGSGTTSTASPETVLHSFTGLAGATPDGSSPTAYGGLVQASDGNLYGMTNGGGAHRNGTVFKISTTGTETVLYSFGATTTDAAYPWAGLIQASDGNLYGMTIAGGTNGTGAVVKFTTSGTETVLYSFGAGGVNDGSSPYGSLIQASDGNLYGVTSLGGANNAGAVVKITLAGVETVLYSFAGGTTDGASPIGNLIQASDGNLYGMTNTGGANGKGVVFKVTTAGAETVLWSLGGAGDGTNPVGGLVQASDGNLYGMTQSGGAYANGTVFRITTTGTETVLHSFAGASSDGARPLGNLIQGSDGNLYGLTDWGGANGGSVGFGTAFKITTSGVETILYNFGATTSDANGPGGSLIQASDGHFYGMTVGGGTYNYGAVFKIN